jgi:nicotinate phosphoribosyltransferase
LSKIHLTNSEAIWLEKACPYFSQSYIEYLKEFRFKPDEHVTLIHTAEDNIQISITGNWAETILYEVPILALVSESFFQSGDKDWNGDMSLQYTAAFEKGKGLIV